MKKARKGEGMLSYLRRWQTTLAGPQGDDEATLARAQWIAEQFAVIRSEYRNAPEAHEKRLAVLALARKMRKNSLQRSSLKKPNF